MTLDTLSYKTQSVNKENADKQWILVDAEGMTVGRLSSRVALVLRGKHKPSFTPHSDCGDNVVIINAEKINLTGTKWFTKEYIRHTGYPGGQRSATAEEVMAKDPTRILESAIKGMLPKNKLSRAILKNLYVYEGPKHKQEAQKPTKIDLNTIR